MVTGCDDAEQANSVSKSSEETNESDVITHWQGWTIRNSKDSTYNVATGSSQKIIYDQNNLLETTYRKHLPNIQSANLEEKVTKGKDGVLRYDFGTWQGALLPVSLVQTSNGEPIFIECTYLRKKNKASRGGGCVSTYEIAPHLKANIKPFEQNMYVYDLENPDHFLNLVKEHREKIDQFLEANPDFYAGSKGEE